MKNVLVISYFWPPAGGPGVQRTLKFVKYMREFGWNPIVLTVSNNQQLGLDESLLSDIPADLLVYKNRILLQKNSTSGKSFSDEKGLMMSFKRWVRGNILIPDSRIFWLFQSKKTIKKIFESNKIDLCFVSGPPQTAHLIGSRVKKVYNLPVVHDFRDPWTDAFFLKDFPRMKIMNLVDKYLERKVVSNADYITAVSEHFATILKSKTEKSIPSLVIENGFDKDVAEQKSSGKKRIVYTGMISDMAIPHKLLNYIKINSDVSLDVYGQVHQKFVDAVDALNATNICIHAPVEHKKITQIQEDADYLLLLIPNFNTNEGHIPGKLFEYLSANRPILGIGPEGRTADILKISNNGDMYSYDETNFDEFFENSYDADVAFIKKYHRKELTKILCQQFDTLV